MGRVQLPYPGWHRPYPYCFNPHPARGPSATRSPALPTRLAIPVSILTRPVGRVQRPRTDRCGHRPQCFNPHPARGPSATLAHLHLPALASDSFNPHPARGPSATRQEPVVCIVAREVSILTRPVGRVQRRRIGLGDWRPEFQSSPGPWAECNPVDAARPSAQDWEFQSSPGPWAECNTMRSHWKAPLRKRFNPHPARGPSATSSVGMMNVPVRLVSILTRPVGRVQHRIPPCSNLSLLFQSSPGPWAECNSSVTEPPCMAFKVFQSSPGPWAECNSALLRGDFTGALFQSSPGPWAECNDAFRSNPTGHSTGFNPHPARGPSATTRPC